MVNKAQLQSTLDKHGIAICYPHDVVLSHCGDAEFVENELRATFPNYTVQKDADGTIIIKSNCNESSFRPVRPEELAEYKRIMEEEVIPAIVEKMWQRQIAAVKSRRKPLKG